MDKNDLIKFFLFFPIFFVVFFFFFAKWILQKPLKLQIAEIF